MSVCLLQIIDFPSNSEDQNAIVSLVAEKAFDRLEWCYLWSVLQVMGFNDRSISMIELLKVNPSTVVITSSNYSARFKIFPSGLPSTSTFICFIFKTCCPDNTAVGGFRTNHYSRHTLHLSLCRWYFNLYKKSF